MNQVSVEITRTVGKNCKIESLAGIKTENFRMESIVSAVVITEWLGFEFKGEFDELASACAHSAVETALNEMGSKILTWTIL